MAKGDYIPVHVDEFDTWEETFFTNIDAVGAALGMTAGEITDIKTKITAHRDAYAVQKNLEQQYSGAVDQTNLLKNIAITDKDGIRDVVKRLKAHTDYTESLGEQLGVVGTEINLDIPNMKPVFTAEKQAGGGVILKFKKHGTDGAEFRSKRGNETAFTFLARDSNSPYPDNRENLTPGVPEQRDYMAIFFKDDQLVGIESDVVSITV